MNSSPRIRDILQVAATTAALAAMIGCSTPASTPPTTAPNGETLVAEQCGRCHPLERVQSARKDRAGWTNTVTRMRSNGLSVTDEQFTAIVDYLTKRDEGK